MIGKIIRRILRLETRTEHGDILIFGIGNPGVQYHETRHNIGFTAIDALAEKLTVIGKKRTCSADVRFGVLRDQDKIFLLAKPLTYVNRCGTSFQLLCKRYGIELSSCLVINDDFNIPLGTIRIRRNGSDGGHNGLKSIIGEVGREFPRIRVGIGPPPENGNIIDFVLGTFSPSEKVKAGKAIQLAAESAMFWYEAGIETAMNRYNG